MKKSEESDSNREVEPVELLIDGVLDLHTFRPAEVKQLVPDYLEACLDQGIIDVRIIHGKGKGVLRKIVHIILRDHPNVIEFKHESLAGSWGATVVKLRAKGEESLLE